MQINLFSFQHILYFIDFVFLIKIIQLNFFFFILGPQFISRITNNTQWKQHGITVAGGNGDGGELNQLWNPFGLSIDNERQSIYIADPGNNRIVEWKLNIKSGQVIAGGNGGGNQMNQLNCPTDVIVDTKNNSLIICDRNETDE